METAIQDPPSIEGVQPNFEQILELPLPLLQGVPHNMHAFVDIIELFGQFFGS